MTGSVEFSSFDTQPVADDHLASDYREVDLSGFGLSHFVKPWERGTDLQAVQFRVDARFSKVEALLFEHGIPPLTVERKGDVTLAIRVEDDLPVEDIVRRVLQLLNRELNS